MSPAAARGFDDLLVEIIKNKPDILEAIARALVDLMTPEEIAALKAAMRAA